jgi:tRNA G10  N-methylase Trm11
MKNATLVLFENVQFIYELRLAQLELKNFNIEFELSPRFKEFIVINEPQSWETLRKRLAYFKLVNGFHSDYFFIIQKNRTKSINQYLTHWIYPYKGKFHPQMIRALLNIIGLKSGDTVLDPFIGSGTTAIEAQLLGINCIGIDISPLCVLQSKVKTESICAFKEIVNMKVEILKHTEINLFNDKTIDSVIDEIEDEKVKNFFLMAKLVAISDNARRRKDITKSFARNLELMLTSVKDYIEIVEQLNLKLGKVDIREGDARALDLGNESVDGIITSPPYSIALDYVQNDVHALKSLGFEPRELREKFIGVRGKNREKIELYNEDMKMSLREMYRVLKPGKYAVLIIGNATYQGKEIKTVEFIVENAEEIGFELVENIDKIIFGLYNVMQKENILIFKKRNG